MSLNIVAAVALVALALLAYKWEFTTTRAKLSRRRNQQWALIIALLAAAALCVLRAVA